MENQDIIKEFLIESSENLTRLEGEIVELEKRPSDPELLASIFRTIHTVKGTCGFLGFSVLESVTHIGENLLSQLRNGERNLTPELISLILESMDAVKKELASIEAIGQESGATYSDLRRRLSAASSECRRSTQAERTGEAVGLEAQGPGALNAPVSTSFVTESVEQSPHEIASSTPPDSASTPPVEILPGHTLPQHSLPIHAPSQPGADAPLHSSAGSSAEAEKESGARPGSIADSTIRVDVGLLDKLMNLVGELVLARNQILQFNSRQDDATLNGTAQRLNLITTQLQEGVMKTRMQPIGMIWNKLPRVVRDLAAFCGKSIRLEMDGAETELDKSIIEAIKDPLTHIVRNSCDHGIESAEVRTRRGKPAQGCLLLRAYHEGGQVNIEIIDDGAGIDATRVKQKAVEKGLLRPEQAERLTERETINLVFLPGFSTAETVSNISGRGVGMDVVRTNIEKIGGVVDLTSRAGEGTTVKIKIPLTLAIIPGLVVNSGGERFVIPQVSLLELLRLEGEAGRKQIERIHGTPVYRRRGALLPIAYLNEALHLPPSESASEVLNIVVLQAEDRQFGLVVDAINDTQEIVVKPLGKQLKGLTAYAGATIMGDGKVALILDVLGVGQRSGVLSESREQVRAGAAKKDQSHEERQTFLLFRAGSFSRLAVPLSLVARLEEFPASQIERAEGNLVVQYRGQLLPLTTLPDMLDGRVRDGGTGGTADPAQVIVFAEGEHMAGLMVDQILDIHDESIRIGKKGDRPGLSGSAVIGGKVTDFLDLPAVLRAADKNWGAGRDASHKMHSTVLVADGSAFSRGLLRNYLELAGHPVVEAASGADALKQLERTAVTAVVTSLYLPSGQGQTSSHGLASSHALATGRGDLVPGSGRQLMEQIRSLPGLTHIPVVALCSSPEELRAEGGGDFDACVERFDRARLLESLSQLARAIEGKTAPQSPPARAGDGR